MNRPEHWLWSHDIKPDQIARLGPAGWTLMSLSSYGDGDRRRFAAVLHKGPGAGRLPEADGIQSAGALRTGERIGFDFGGGERP